MNKKNETFWIKDFSSLFNKNNFYEFWPSTHNTLSANLNSLSRFIIYISIILAIIKKNVSPLIIGLIFLIIIIIMYYFTNKEKFTNTSGEINRVDQPLGELYEVLPFADPSPNIINPTRVNTPAVNNYPSCNTEEACVKPSNDNPMMNPPLYKEVDEKCQFSYDTQPEGEFGACNQFGIDQGSQNISKDVEKKWANNLFKGTQGALWERVNSQRQFYTANGDEFPYEKMGEFANWLYGKKYVCKSGSIYMHDSCGLTPEDSLVCTGNDAAEPSNFGIDF